MVPRAVPGTGVRAGRNLLCYNFCRARGRNHKLNLRRRAQGVSTIMSSTKQRIRLMGAFAALATLALAISCRGFFVNPTLTSIAISPTAPQVQQGKTLQLEAFGTYDDGSRSQVKSGISWASDTSSVATVDPTTGILTGVATGTATITASAQALSSTATATVFLIINSIAISPTTANITTN